MTVKFFPLFFRNECGMSPNDVNILYIVTYTCLALATQAAQQVSRRIGQFLILPNRTFQSPLIVVGPIVPSLYVLSSQV